MEVYLVNWGWIVCIVLVTFIVVYKKITKNPDAITSKYETRKKIKGLPQHNLELIKQALKNAGFKKVGIDEEERSVYARTSFSMSSFLEYIEITYQQRQEQTELNFKSICALPTQIYDWGKNKRNFKKFEKEIDKLLQPETPALS